MSEQPISAKTRLGHRKRTPVVLVQVTEDPEVNETFKRVLERGAPTVPNIHRTMANSPSVSARFADLTNALRFHTEINPADRELAILCVLERHCGDYELKKHRPYGRTLGLTADQVANVCNPNGAEYYSDRQREILRFAERFAADPREVDTLPADNIENYLNNRERIELAMTLALYMGVAHFTSVLDVPDD